MLTVRVPKSVGDDAATPSVSGAGDHFSFPTASAFRFKVVDDVRYLVYGKHHVVFKEVRNHRPISAQLRAIVELRQGIAHHFRILN